VTNTDRQTDRRTDTDGHRDGHSVIAGTVRLVAMQWRN